MGVVDLKIVKQTNFKVLSRAEIAALKKPTGQDAKPQLNLVEPRAMCRRKVNDMLMAWIAQESSPLHTSAEVLSHKGYLAPLGDLATDLKAPVGIENIDHPVVTFHLWQLFDDMGQMGGEIATGTGGAQIPHYPTR